MPGPAAVGVDDDLAAGQAGVAHRATDHEVAGRIDQQPEVGGVQALVGQVLDDRVDDMLTDVGGQLVDQVDAFGVLGGEHHGVQPDGRGALVLDGHLGLAVRAQVAQRAVLADLGQLAGQPVRQRDRQRHEFGGVADRVAEHQALVAGALGVQRILLLLDAGLVGLVDAHRDVRGLPADADVHAAGGAVEALLRGVVADLQDALANGVGDVGERLLGRGGDLAHDVHLAGGDQGLHRDARGRVVLQQRIEDRVTDRVTDLVGMSFGHRLAGEQPTVVAHKIPLC